MTSTGYASTVEHGMLFRTIETRRGVEDPAYQPPERAPDVGLPDETGFSALELAASLVFPFAAVVFAVLRFSREQVGKGLALLLIGLVSTGLWTLLLNA